MAQVTASSSSRLVQGIVRLHGGELPYQIFLPAGYSRNRQWPVLLFLHGAGERGVDGRRQTRVGIGPALRQFPERFPLLAIMPQCPTGATWRPFTDELLLALKETMRTYGGDSARIYLSGVSMGAYGTWDLAAQRPDLFAGLVPICGGGNPTFAAQRLVSKPVWAFHGALDSVVSVEQSREMVAALKKAGSMRIRYTEYETGFHNVWDAAYAEKELMPWLLMQSTKHVIREHHPPPAAL